MQEIFKKGAIKTHTFIVSEKDCAHFNEQKVHEVCATFTLAREIEWATRLFILEMLEANEEGIGTHLNIKHKSPALVGEKIEIEAKYDHIHEGEIICSFQAMVEDRIIAVGTSGQKILPKAKIDSIFGQVRKGN